MTVLERADSTPKLLPLLLGVVVAMHAKKSKAEYNLQRVHYTAQQAKEAS